MEAIAIRLQASTITTWVSLYVQSFFFYLYAQLPVQISDVVFWEQCDFNMSDAWTLELSKPRQ